MGYTFRTARPDDLDRLIEIHTSAFPDPRGYEARRRNFESNPLGTLGSLWVAEEGAEIVGHAFLFPLRAWFAGGTTSAAGIASVGVAPEWRKRGLATAMLTHLHERANAMKAAISMLYPFRQAFYARSGYAAVSPNRRLRLHPASIPAAWLEAAPSDGITLRRANARTRGVAHDHTAIVNAYGRAAARTHGWLVRPEALWNRAFSDERRVWTLAFQGRKVTGYVVWSLDQAEPHAVVRLLVHEVATDDDATRRALLGAVGAQRDQVAEVEMEVDARDPIDRALLDVDRARFGTREVEHTLGIVAGGPMVRLVDTARGITSRAYLADGSIDLAIDERPPLHVVVNEGRAKLSVPRFARAPVRVERAALAAVLYGGLSMSDAVRLGWARGEEASIARADALFASPPFFALDGY